VHDYELTDRGKIIIAVVLVLLFLVLPSVLLLANANGNQPTTRPPERDTDPPDLPQQVDTSPSPTESPPPGSGGFVPPDVSEPIDDDDVGGVASCEVPMSGQPVLNSSEGTLSFLFSPELQSSLDADTLVLLNPFLFSPMNTPGSLIAVELPRVSPIYVDTLSAAVTSAFSELGVSEQRLAFLVRSENGSDEVLTGEFARFTVNMYFVAGVGK